MAGACEIRVPTFRRPKLLERALRSIAAQTLSSWRCIVFDDCPESTGKSVVKAMNDDRFVYRHNDRQLGAIGNIDQCFRNRPYLGGRYACVVEDDNYLLPGHLEMQVRCCHEQNVDVTLSAQWCEKVIAPGEPGELTTERTIAWIYPEGRHGYRSLLPSILFSHAFSNGSVFWRIGCASDLEIGGLTKHTGIQETLRMLRLRNAVYVSHQPTAIWRWNDPIDSHVTSASRRGLIGRVRAAWVDAIMKREIMDYRSRYIEWFGTDDVLRYKHKFESRHYAAIERSVLLCGRYIELTERPTYWRLFQIAKGYALRMLVQKQIREARIEAPSGGSVR